MNLQILPDHTLASGVMPNRLAQHIKRKTMSKLAEKRANIMRGVMQGHGIHLDNGEVIMSMWDMADTVNNFWHAADFLSKEALEENADPSLRYSRQKVVVSWWRTNCLFKGLRHAVKNEDDMEVKKSPHSGVLYVVWKKP